MTQLISQYRAARTLTKEDRFIVVTAIKPFSVPETVSLKEGEKFEPLEFEQAFKFYEEFATSNTVDVGIYLIDTVELPMATRITVSFTQQIVT